MVTLSEAMVVAVVVVHNIGLCSALWKMDGPVWIAIQPSCTGFLQVVQFFGDPELKHGPDRYNAVRFASLQNRIVLVIFQNVRII